MDIGMLWYCNDPKSDLSVKVSRAVSYYKKKYGKKPNLCFVNPSMIEEPANGNGKNEEALIVSNVEIRESSTMLQNHFWIGVHDG